MKVAITQKNEEKIVSELKKINGKSTSHCYTTYSEIEKIALRAEQQCNCLLSAKKGFVAASFSSESGDIMSNSYKGTRNTTSIKIVRGSKDWFLVNVKQSQLWPNQYGREGLTFTAEQDRIAVEKVRARYDIL